MAMEPEPRTGSSSPQDVEVLISCFDWARFHGFSRRHSSREVFDALDAFYRTSEALIYAAQGCVIKFLGDAGLAFFPGDRADTGVLTLLSLKESVDRWMRSREIDSFLHVNCHYGMVTLGAMGGPETRRLDLIGDNVNLCFALEHKGFTITPQAFRRLGPDTRKRFKKFTPPIVYHLASS